MNGHVAHRAPMIMITDNPERAPAATDPPLVPHRLRELRDALNLKQREVAEAIGMSVVNYNRLENGEVELTARTIAALRGFYEIGTGDLFEARRPLREVPVARIAEAGMFVADPEIPKDERIIALLAEDEGILGRDVEAATVHDNHAADRYPAGSTVFYLPLREDGHAAREGPRYVVQRQRPDGTAEVSVRRLVRQDDGGRWWLAGHPAIAGFPEHGSGGGETVIVLGRIVRAHVKEE